MDIATILTLVEFAIEEEPKVADSLKKIFSKANPTPEDWEAERAAIAGMSYQQLVPNTGLTPDQAAPPPAAPSVVTSSSGEPVQNTPKP